MLFKANSFVALDPTQEPIFPPALKARFTVVMGCFSDDYDNPFALQMSEVIKPLAIRGPRMQWYRPTTLDQLLVLREQFPRLSDSSKPQHGVIAGGTALGKQVV